MAKKKPNLNKTNSSGWLDDYSEEFSINKFPNGTNKTGLSNNNPEKLKENLPLKPLDKETILRLQNDITFNDPLLSKGEYQQIKNKLKFVNNIKKDDEGLYIPKKNINELTRKYIKEELTPEATLKNANAKKEVEKDFKKSVDFFENYYNSPRYKEMLKNSIGNNSFLEDAYNQKRIDNLRTTAAFSKNNDEGNPNTFGYSNSYSGDISILPPGRGSKYTMTHELSHSSDRPYISSLPNELFRDLGLKTRFNPTKSVLGNALNIGTTENRSIPYLDEMRILDNQKKFDSKFHLNKNNINEEDFNSFYRDYVGEPTEVRARLMEIRRGGLDNNIYNPFKEKVTPESYKKLKDYFYKKENIDSPIFDLEQLYDENKVINFLNEISQNKEDNSLPIAKDGGEIYTDMKKNIEKYPEGGIIKKTLPEVVISDKRPSKDENDWMDYMAMVGMGAQLAGAGASSTGVGVLAGGPLALAGYAMGVPDAIRDTYNSYNKGNYGDAALSSAGLIPGFKLMKDLGMLNKGARFVNKAENFNKTINALNVLDRLKEEAEKNKSNQKILGTSKYPAGGYLNYQEGFKGFGVGPELYQDNSYFRSVMPDNIENIEEQINQPSVFSGINDVLGSVNQGVNQITGLMNKLPQSNETGNIMPDVNWWGKGGAAEGLMQKTDEQLNFENDQKLKQAGLFESFYPSQTPTIGPSMDSSSSVWKGVPFLKNGGYLKKYQDGGNMDMLPVGSPEYIHKSNVFHENYNPVPRVHFSDDTTPFDIGVNLNDLVNMNGGRVKQYAAGGDLSLQGYFNYLTNQTQNAVPKNAFNTNSGRATLGQLQAANANDFLNTKVRQDRQSFEDDKVDWGFMNWAKEPVGAYVGIMSTVPILGDVTKDIVGDSFLTRTKGYQVGKGVGKTTFGAGKIAGGIATGNVAMVGSGIGDVGEGVGSTYGNLAARDSLAGYDKSGYVSNKKLERASQDFGNMMNTASSLYGNVSGGVNQLKGLGGMKGMMGNLKGGETGMKGFGNVMGKISGFAQDGGMVDPDYLALQEFLNGGLTPNKAKKMLHDKSFTTDKQRKYFGYIASQNKKSEGGWLDSL